MNALMLPVDAGDPGDARHGGERRDASRVGAVEPAAPARWRWLSFWWALALFAAADLALIRAGEAVTLVAGPLVFWPPAGLTLGALLLSPRRRWLAILATASTLQAIVGWAPGKSLALSLLLLGCDALGPLLGAWLAQRLCRGLPRLHRFPDLVAFLAAGPLVAAGLAALPAAGGLWMVSHGAFAEGFRRLWLAAALGMLTVAPLLLAWLEPTTTAKVTWARLAEFLGLAASFAASTWLVFLLPGRGLSFEAVVLFPVLLWAALRFGPRGTTLAGLSLATVALWVTGRGVGVFPGSAPLAATVLSAQLFTGVVLASLLAMTSVVESRRLGALALVESQHRLKLIRFAMDAASDLIACALPSGEIVYVNDAFCAVARRDREALVGRPLWSFFEPGDARRWAQHWVEVKRRGAAAVELLAAAPGAEPVPVELRSSYLCFGGAEYCVSAARDLRERRKAEVALRLAGIGTLAAGMAHEINNPLAYVLGNLEWMADQVAQAAPSAPGAAGGGAAPAAALAALGPVLQETAEGATRIRDIVRDLKLFSRTAERDTPAAADVGRAVRSAVTLSRNELRHRARLVLELSPVPPVASDEGRLGQVFLNLLLNAAQAIPDGHLAENTIRVATGRGGPGEVTVEIQDTGCGMAPGVLARIFEPFFTTKPVGAGTGLGLSICHGIVAGMGGRIEVTSQPGAGSLFRVVLPAAGEEALAAAPAPAPVPRASHARILLVDDDPLMGRALERLLPEHEVVACTSPTDALTRVRDQAFDLVLCDLMMPEMTGMELQERLARHHPALAARLVFVTGGAFTPTAQAFLERTPSRHLEKPFDAAALRAEVARALAPAP